MTVMLLEWVCTATFLILVVLALRAALGRRISAGLRYALWAVVLLRLLVPVQLFTSPIAGTWVVTEKRVEHSMAEAPSAPAGLGDAPSLSGQYVPALEVGQGAAPNFPDPPSMPAAPEPPAAPDLTKLPIWLGWAWLAGTGVVALVLLLSNLRFYGRLRRVRTRLEGADCPLAVYAAPGVPSPCLFGLFRPAVYVTPETAEDTAMLRHVLAHEYTHFRHGDHIWSLLRCAALAAHWWNPLVWVAAGLSRRDAELACDEGALKRLGDGERAAYGNTLLSLVTAKPGPEDLFRCATTMAGDKKSLKERITRIAQAPKRWLWAAVAVVMATALACVVAFGQAEEQPAAREPVELPTADLAFTLETSEDGKPFVRIEGQVEDRAVKRTTWHTESYAPLYTVDDQRTEEEQTQEPELSTGYEFSADWAELTAKWADEERTSVTLSTWMSASLSSYGNSGYWVFTVELSRGGGEVVFKEHSDGRFGTGELKLYPASLPDEEAIQAARYAAKLLTAAEGYYHSLGEKPAQAAPEVETVCDVSAVPQDVLDAVKADVAGKFQAYAPGGLHTAGGEAYQDETGKWVQAPLEVEFDGARINQLDGPWTGTVLGMELEVWRINYEFHTTMPEFGENLLVGGNGLTEDGWLRPTYPGCTYEIFLLDETGGRSFAASIMYNMGGPSEDEEESAGFFREFWPYAAQALAGARLIDPSKLTPDLNGNGVPEELRLTPIGEGMGQRLEVYEDGRLIFSEEGYNAHAGYNALFLCTLDGEDYLLRYHPYMGQGWCTYSYKLFTLGRAGEENAVREGAVEFDLNFQPEVHQGFDVNAIWDFVEDVNGLLANSVQLLNTDADLLDTFDRLGRLEDDLGWLGWWEPAYVRQSQGYWSLPNELWAFKAAMEERQYAEAPAVFPVDENGTDIRLSYRDKTARFVGSWDYHFQPAETVEPQVLDLDGDGRDEIVVILVEGHGTGVSVDNLYVFDADTLEQYDTSGLTGMILGSVESTGDGENYCLTGPGLDETIPREDGAGPTEDALVLGDIVGYSVKDGVVFCFLGCDASGFGSNYVGRVEVELEFSGGAFRCAGCTYVPF